MGEGALRYRPRSRPRTMGARQRLSRRDGQPPRRPDLRWLPCGPTRSAGRKRWSGVGELVGGRRRRGAPRGHHRDVHRPSEEGVRRRHRDRPVRSSPKALRRGIRREADAKKSDDARGDSLPSTENRLMKHTAARAADHPCEMTWLILNGRIIGRVIPACQGENPKNPRWGSRGSRHPMSRRGCAAGSVCGRAKHSMIEASCANSPGPNGCGYYAAILRLSE